MRNDNVGVLIFIAFVIVILNPLLCWISGWIFGWLLRLLIGGTFIANLNQMFNTNFSAENLPVFCGVLSVIGHFFKSSPTLKMER